MKKCGLCLDATRTPLSHRTTPNQPWTQFGYKSKMEYCMKYVYVLRNHKKYRSIPNPILLLNIIPAASVASLFHEHSTTHQTRGKKSWILNLCNLDQWPRMILFFIPFNCIEEKIAIALPAISNYSLTMFLGTFTLYIRPLHTWFPLLSFHRAFVWGNFTFTMAWLGLSGFWGA